MASSISALHSPLSCRLCRRSSPTGLFSRSRPACALPSSPFFFEDAASLFGSHGRNPPVERRAMRIRAVAEEETLVSESGGDEVLPEAAPQADQPVSVPVSPSDVLTMFFKAEGTMDEAAIANVTKGLEGLEGISDLKVRVLEGIASVELAKQTTVQATGVASNLLEIVQGSGFKLQTLHLSFEDEEDAI
ncbi:unnamed protein product [Spirodela intermedia]|uniref:Uncharacterized protein n=1 Tax=Spirodela intermedia TaxID=51605 RepID=A0A7I8IDD1_SPIIN|nr:unnamed protein product [Spirodela intermedia]CAA6655395.1 unnamed protein product [Spirodela intermedia]